jgi:tetratricopeptide (TPR) repeat protein
MLKSFQHWVSDLFGKNKFHEIEKQNASAPVSTKEGLFFSRELTTSKRKREKIHSDVHKMMIRATKIRKTEGYGAAIVFLKELAEHYLNTQNTALVICMNKLIPYMKRDPEQKYKSTKKYLGDVINRSNQDNPYFLNLHITMANLIRSRNLKKAIEYLSQQLEKYQISPDTYNLQITLIDLLVENGEIQRANILLKQAKELLSGINDRYELIKKERKWFRSSARLHSKSPGKNHKVQYLNHRFIEFALDMARVSDPLHISCFHERKDLYYKGERGFIGTDDYEKTLTELGIESKKEALLLDIFGFCFEEMPEILGITKKQLNYVPGDLESIEELSAKKMYLRKPFKELPEIEKRVEKLVNKYIE